MGPLGYRLPGPAVSLFPACDEGSILPSTVSFSYDDLPKHIGPRIYRLKALKPGVKGNLPSLIVSLSGIWS